VGSSLADVDDNDEVAEDSQKIDEMDTAHGIRENGGLGSRRGDGSQAGAREEGQLSPQVCARPLEAQETSNLTVNLALLHNRKVEALANGIRCA
jgi:hypothetical protein